MSFTADEIARCEAAMSKPAPIEMTKDGRDVLIDSLDGRPVRDPEHPERKMLLTGAWPLRRAGMIDEFGVVTEKGKALLASVR